MRIQCQRTHACAMVLAAAAALVMPSLTAGQAPAIAPATSLPAVHEPPPVIPTSATVPATNLPADQDEPPAPAPAPAAGPAPKPSPKSASAPAEAETTVRIARPGTFEIHFRDSGLREAFELLGSQGHKNIVATKEVSGKVNADLYDVTFKEALEAILNSTGFAYVEQGNFIYVMTPEQFQKRLDLQKKLSVKAFHLAYITAADAKTLIAPAMSKDGTISLTPVAAMGLAASSTDGGGNSYATSDLLVVHDYDENLVLIDKIIRDMDVRPQQVLIEATILRVSLSEENALGIDFNTLAGVDFTALTSTTSGLTDVTTPVVPVTKSITPAGTFRTDFAGSVPSGGASFGFIGNNMAVFVRAVESITDTTILANPKLLVVNKQRGEVMVGNHDGYLTTTVTETVATQTVQFLDTGIRLIVRPYIGKDGYIRMEIHPEDSTGGVSVVGTSVLPKSSMTEVTSNVLVRDGHTIVIGGLFREETDNNRSQVPLVGNIPILGTALRSTDDKTTRDEIIILITPHIVQQATDEAVSEQIMDDMDRYRIGARKGLQWFGRSRLANSYVQMAKDDIANGKIDTALFNLDAAMSMQPRLIEAIRLKERLTQKAYWADENQVSTVRFVIQHMMMQELGRPTSEIIPPGKPLNIMRLDPAVRKAFDIEREYEAPLPIRNLVGHAKPRDHAKSDPPAGTTNKPGGAPSPATKPSDATTPTKGAVK